MSARTRWGILGTGHAAREFARDLKLLPNAELLAVGSRKAATAKPFSLELKAPRAYASYDALLEDPDVDVVYVATPHSMHRDHCVRALQAGKPVLCEKPFTINAREAREVIGLAREKRLFCMEAMRMRFLPLFERLVALIDDGVVGEPQMLTADFSLPTERDENSRVFDRNLGGGALLERGIYCLSLASRVFGPPVDEIGRAFLGKTGIDEESAAVMTYRGGGIAIVSASLRSRGSNAAMIMGSDATIRIHEPFYKPHRLSVTRSPRKGSSTGGDGGLKQRLRSHADRIPYLKRLYLRLRDHMPSSSERIVKTYQGNSYQYEAGEVMRCLRAGELESGIMPLDETLSILETMDRIRSQCLLRYPQDRESPPTHSAES